jgi:hypothetical protein
MEQRVPARICTEQTIDVGKPIVIDGPSPSGNLAVVFEDDGDTGYLYAVDLEAAELHILDAVHIYNSQSVTDRDIPSLVQIIWSEDGLKALLCINRYPHAAFDFSTKTGHCRTGFPKPPRQWTRRAWNDAVLELFS